MDLVELFMHWDAGCSKSELAVSLGMDRKTVYRYLAPAEAEGLTPGLTAREWQDMVAGWFPTIVDGSSPGRSSTPVSSGCGNSSPPGLPGP